MVTFLNGPPSVLQVLALFAALIGLAIMLPRSRNDLLLRLRGVRTTGEVVVIHYGNETANAPTIAFTDDQGVAHRLRSDLPLHGDKNFVGAPIPVIYDPRQPSRASEADRPLAKLVVNGLVYALIVFCLLVALLRPFAAAIMGSLAAS
jgi:hypothetical protein